MSRIYMDGALCISILVDIILTYVTIIVFKFILIEHKGVDIKSIAHPIVIITVRRFNLLFLHQAIETMF